MIEFSRSNDYSYLYPNFVKDFDVAMKYINFTFSLSSKRRSDESIINVGMAVPFLVEADLFRIYYVPIRNGGVQFIEDKSITHIAASYLSTGRDCANDVYFLIKNIDLCDLVGETFLCDPALVTKGNCYQS